ncbi:hypothetical protein MJO52_02915 [Microbulbifer variabilis]|uniref:Uncharacterized protein n=1 Tax=Microbulbifer variabilis TaxID=266805 RepID=A0ABY4VCS7_9GAMM|nr:hypothetical protein [Microbulbifer variabilis]USD22105.1 hypothetical protein MJO52_02915 [Microbulbifer variabilis]
MTLSKRLGAGLSVFFAAMVGTSAAVAENCYILVHGHGVEGHTTSTASDGSLVQPALDYWSETYFDEYKNSSFIDQLLISGGNYGVVGYNSTDEGELPYWHDKTSGEIARQIIQIRSGAGDRFEHENQCSADDTFWIISHSQGAAQMMYIAGNAVEGSPYYNRAYNQYDTDTEVQDVKKCSTTWWGSKSCKTVSEEVQVASLSDTNAVTVDFDSAISGVAAIFTTGGAITGTEGVDRICNGTWYDEVINDLFFGRECAAVRYMQTNDIYTVRNYVGTNLGAPVYTIGGYAGFPGAESVSSALLNGEDDGYINLASQMNCSGSGKRSLWSNLKQYDTFMGIAYGSATFSCDNDNKGTARSYNLASIYTDHDAQRNGGILSPDYDGIPDGLNCGVGKNSAGRIAACTQ